MRFVALTALAVLVLALAACGESRKRAASDGPQPRLPTIAERFTLLPCPRDRGRRGSTIGIEGCEEHATARADRDVAASERAIFAGLSSPGRAAFARAEASWLAFRRSYCEARESEYVGGSIAPVIFGSCAASLTRRHADSLAAWLDESRNH